MKIRTFIITSFIGGCIELVLGTTITPDGQINIDYRSLIAALTISVLVGLVIEISTSFVKAVNELNNLIVIIDKIKHAWDYNERVTKILNQSSDINHRIFVKQLLNQSLKENVWQIPNQSAIDFYNILIDGFQYCNKWEGVHDGSIRQLIDEHNENDFDDLLFARQRYLKSLKTYSLTKNKNKFKARRIIILDKEQRKELDNPFLMYKFWESTGKYVNSYWIAKESVEKELNGRNLDDAALLDSYIFLQYDRNNRIIRFSSDENTDEKLMLVKKLFDLLYSSKNVYQFTPITKEMCALSENMIKRIK